MRRRGDTRPLWAQSSARQVCHDPISPVRPRPFKTRQGSSQPSSLNGRGLEESYIISNRQEQTRACSVEERRRTEKQAGVDRCAVDHPDGAARERSCGQGGALAQLTTGLGLILHRRTQRRLPCETTPTVPINWHIIGMHLRPPSLRESGQYGCEVEWDYEHV